MSLSSREASLRQTIAERPRSGRARAELALLLHQESKHSTRTGVLADKEAMSLVDEAIQVAPSKPFGHVVRSMIVSNHLERMSAIRQALQVMKESGDSSSFCITKIELLIRLLVEPRRHANDMRRALNKDEQAIYKHILSAIKTAIASDCTTMALGQSHYHLGTLFRKMAPPAVHQPRARRHFHLAMELLPEPHRFRQLATFWLATLDSTRQHTLVNKCPPEYIVSLYSTFAQCFDELLVTKLSYQTPTLLRRLVDECNVVRQQHSQQWARRAADLGCGTGLSGMAFRETCRHLLGVDLSPEMIDRARAKDFLYDDFVVGDVTCILASFDSFDFIFSCDVLVYIGDLKQVFTQVYASLVANGVFAFSVELLEEEHHANPYKLHECARFAHKQSYILKLAQEHNFQVLGKRACAIRKNKGDDVEGLLVVLRKRVSGS